MEKSQSLADLEKIEKLIPRIVAVNEVLSHLDWKVHLPVLAIIGELLRLRADEA